MDDNQDIIPVTFFLAIHGRMPLVEEGEKPWQYKGWLLFYVQEMHAHPGVDFPDRWGYLATVKLGSADPGPIPRVEFGAPDSTVMRDLHKAVDIAGSYGARGWGWTAFRLLLDFLSFGLGISDNRPDLDDAVQERLYRHLNLGPWLLKPSDYLGYFASERHAGGWNPNAFYPTPHPVCEAMVAMQMADTDVPDQRWAKVLDCCVGTGRMLLHASNHSLHLYGQDIDPMMVQITLINGALYAPWLACPPNPITDAVTILPPPPALDDNQAVTP